MAEKQTESICPGITGSSSHLASTYGNDFVELVWQNGQILVQGGSSSGTLKRPSRFGHSTNPSHEAYDEDEWIAKRAKLNTLYSLLDSSHKNSRQAHDPCSYPFDLKCTESNGFSKPGDELSNLRGERESNSKPAGGNTQICSTSLQTHKKHDLGPDERVERINFSNFLRPALFFKSTYQGNSASRRPNSGISARVEEIKATDGGSSKALDHSDVIDSAKGSHSLNGVHPGQTALTSNKANSTTPFDGKKDQETLPDEQSEAVGCDRALKSQWSHGHYHHQTRSRKGKTAAGFSSAPFVASSSLCSLGVGASNDLSLHSTKHEDTDDSTHTSDNDEETEDTTTKEMPAQDGSRGKRIRNTQKRNLSERKRRDEINKKMRALKQLIPDCNKMDKASMLDDAIDYLKTLKLQLQVLSMGSGVCMPLMMSMFGIGIPCGVPPHQFLPQVPPHPHPHAIANNCLQMLNAGFPNHVIPNIQFPMSQQSPFISMPPKPIQPYLSSHPSTFDHNSDLNAQLVSAAMPKATQASNGNADHAHSFGATCRK